MRRSSSNSTAKMVVMTVMMAILLSTKIEALSQNFYSNSCPNVESLVREVVEAAFAADRGVAAGLIRLQFHDCFVRGCDASVLLDGDDTEKTAIPNLSLRGLEVIDDAKAKVEAACPGVVSCADIITFASRDSTELAGNFGWRVFAGRRDGSVSIKAEAEEELPSPLSDATTLVDSFAAKGLSAREMVALSGAHSIGRANCAAFTNRLYNFNSTFDVDPTLSSAYASLLKDRCPSPDTNDVNAMLDIFTPNTLDNRYYLGVENKMGLLTSDAALVTDDSLVGFVRADAQNERGWANRFGRAMEHMGSIGVLEGNEGEIRSNCRVVNSQSSSTFVRGGDGYAWGRATQ